MTVNKPVWFPPAPWKATPHRRGQCAPCPWKKPPCFQGCAAKKRIPQQPELTFPSITWGESHRKWSISGAFPLHLLPFPWFRCFRWAFSCSCQGTFSPLNIEKREEERDISWVHQFILLPATFTHLEAQVLSLTAVQHFESSQRVCRGVLRKFHFYHLKQCRAARAFLWNAKPSPRSRGEEWRHWHWVESQLCHLWAVWLWANS